MISPREVPRYKKMTVDEVLSFSFKTVFKEISALFIWVLMCLILFIVNLGAVFLLVKVVDSGGTLPIWAVSESRIADSIVSHWGIYLILGLILLLLDIYFSLFSTTYLYRVGIDSKMEETRSVSERLILAFKETFKLIPAYLLYFVIGVGVMLPYLIFAGMEGFAGRPAESVLSLVLNLLGSVVTMILAVRFFCWYIIMLVEGLGPIESLKKTFDMTKGRFFRILGYTILISLIVGFIGLLSMIPFVILWVFIGATDFQMTFVSIGAFLSVIAYVVLMGFSAVVNTNAQVAVYFALMRENEPEIVQVETVPVVASESDTLEGPDDFQI